MVFLFDTDTSNNETLLKNINFSRSMKNIGRVLCIPQILNLEDELEFSCGNIKNVTEITQSRSQSDFKRDFLREKNIAAKLKKPMEEYRNLTIRNSFMFAAVFSDHRLLAQLLARILPQEHIDPDSIVIKEKDDKAYYGSRGVRYDVFHTDGKHLFDVELQIRQDPFLFDRAVYNSSSMIMSQVHPGTDTYELTFKTYVIFICAYDVNHGKRLKQYTFKDEEGKNGFDKVNIIMIGCASKENDNEQLKNFADYIMDPSNITDDPFIREIEQGVQWRRRDPESGKAYMDWMYEKSRAIRDTRVQDMQNM